MSACLKRISGGYDGKIRALYGFFCVCTASFRHDYDVYGVVNGGVLPVGFHINI